MTEKKINKSAKDGKFVSNKEIKKNPDTTYQQTVKVPKKGSTNKK